MPLVYNLINNGTEYQIGAGSCTAGSVIIPDTYLGKPVTSIGQFAFINCSTITSVSIPSSVTFINYRAFYRCVNLQNIIFSEGLTSIGEEAFRECSKLESIIFPTTLNYIGSRAFWLSFNPQFAVTITIQSNISNVPNSLDAPFSGSYIRHVIVSSGVSILFDYLFIGCTSLLSVNLPNSLINIGAYCFSSCRNLALTSLPSNLEVIGEAAFSFCSVSIVNIKIPDTVTYLGAFAFTGCTNLQSIVLSKNITSLRASTFSDCFNLKGPLFVSDKVISIGNFCFSRCYSLRKIYFEGNAPSFGSNIFDNIFLDTKLYRKKNFVTGWPTSVQGKEVVLWSDNVVKSGGTGKLTTWNRSVDRDALKYIQLIESLTSPNNPITPDSKDKINSFIKQIKQIVPWNNFTAWTFIQGQNAFPFLNFTDNKYNGIVKTFGGLGGGEVISANSSTSSANEGLSFSSPGGVLAISPSSFFTSVKSIFGVFKPKDNFYYSNPINQSIFSVYGGSGPTTYTYSNLYYRSDAVYSRITRNSIDNIQTNYTSVFNLNFYKSLGTIFDANSTSNYSNGIKQFTASPLSVPNPSLFNGVSIGGGIVNGGTIPFVFVSDLVLTDAQMLAIHNIYKSTLGANLTNSQL